ncbi:urease accessory protein UreF [Rhizobium sp.]
MITDNPQQSLLRLMTWLSPAFPVGGFAYSGGLEMAVREGHVANAAGLRDWLEMALTHGQFRNDAVLLAESWHAHDDDARLAEATDLARAMAGSAERHLEVTAQGNAFLDAALPWSPQSVQRLEYGTPYAVAVGAIAAANGVELEATLVAWLHALISQSVSAAIRLGVLGQREAMTLLAELEQTVLDTARRAASSSLDDLGSATAIADILSARHENLHSRLFRS